jgi:aminopeptidase N
VVTSFKTTPPMPTYLVAFAVTDFDYRSNIRDGPAIFPREFRVYAKPQDIEHVDYAMDFGQRAITYLQGYTDVNYRLPKVDNIAIPQMRYGSMENWGLATYDERGILSRKGISTTQQDMYIGITHQYAHFWYGNEVTPSWWNHLWMNEGFATFYSYHSTDKVRNQ